jgi:hypothetical protein
MKTLCCFLCSLFCAVAMPMTAPAQQTVDPYDWFKLGVSAWALQRFEFYHAVSESPHDRLKEIEAVMKKLDVPSDVLSAFNTLAQLGTTLPFSKGFNEWTEAEQQKWKTEGWDAEDKVLHGLNSWLEKKPQPLFFYVMGRSSLVLGWTASKDIRYYGLAKEMPEIQLCVRDFIWMWLKKDLMATLAPEARDAVKTITDMFDKARLKDAMTQADVDKMVTAAQAILDLARDNKLVQ